MYGVTNAQVDGDTSRMQAWKNAGGTHVHLPIFWDRWQASNGSAASSSAVSEWRGWYANARTVGLRVILEINYTTAPTWYTTGAAPRYKNQSGTTYTADGDTYRDVVFSQTARTQVAGYFTAIRNALSFSSDWDLTDTVRVGGGPVGELNYPPGNVSNPDGNTPSWWYFSGPAQTGTDLATGQTVAPSAGGLAYPFASTAAGTVATANDTTLYTWYSNSLVNYMQWQIAQVRSMWSGLIHVLHPSFGVRYSRGSGDLNWRFQMAQGCDWGRQMDGYGDGKVYPWCTWANRPPDTGYASDDGSKSPIQYLLELAQARGTLAAKLMGENAAGASNADASLMWTDSNGGMIPLGYRGVMWVSYDSLTAGGSNGTLSAVGALMASHPATSAITT